jgi:transposase
VRDASLWRALLGVEKTVVEGVEFDAGGGQVVVSVRPSSRARFRCGVCSRRCPRYDLGEGRRRWRGLDLGTMLLFLEAEAPRVTCQEHGVVVAQVPWAKHGAGHTHAFDDQIAWLAVRSSKTTVAALMRIAWRTVGAVITRVAEHAIVGVDQFEGLRRIGIDEISYKRGHKYLTVVVDHDSGRLVWAAPGRDRETLRGFFDQLGPERAALITHISADAADWVAEVVAERCPEAVQCADPFHVVAWATEALDEIRRETWNAARKEAAATRRPGPGHRRAHGSLGKQRSIVRSRWALWKNPENLTENQQAKLAWIAKTEPRLHRAYLLKEGLRHVFVFKGQAGIEALDRWCSWARRSRIPAFVKLTRRIVRHRAKIVATLLHGLSNALIESTNTKIRLLTRMAFGFHGPEPLIALAMLAHGGYCPPLPGRRPTHGSVR